MGWPDGVARRRGGCPMESGRAPVRGGRVPDGGWVSGGGPTGDYIRAPGPHFWVLSSSAQSHLQEMRVCRVLMSENAEIPKGILFEVKLEILGLDLNVSHYFEMLNISVF
jgi:hypothetical protein